MVFCQAIGCYNDSSRTKGKSFYSIPDPVKERERCAKWIAALKSAKFNLNNYQYTIEIMSFVATTLNHGASSMIWKRSYAVQDLEKSSKMMLFLPFSYIEDRLRCAHQVKEGFLEDVLNRLVILIIFPFYNFILPGFKNQPPAVYLYCAARAVVVC